jgi:hypothetical protein
MLTNTPQHLKDVKTNILDVTPLELLAAQDPTMRSSVSAGRDVAEIAVGDTFRGKTGLYTWLQEVEGPLESLDEVRQEELWKKTLQWASLDVSW